MDLTVYKYEYYFFIQNRTSKSDECWFTVTLILSSVFLFVANVSALKFSKNVVTL